LVARINSSYRIIVRQIDKQNNIGIRND
jgi:hypothetical protein